MHQNFFHWHSRAELKPDAAILEPRWNAAVKFAEKLSSPDICSLLRLVLFPGAESVFAKRFTEALVKSEPTFPIERNAELLRAMAAAAICSHLEESSTIADAFALGLRAAEFPNGRIEPVCQDVMIGAAKYLVGESEAMRPAIDIGAADKQVTTHLATLKKAAETNVPQELGKATEAFGRGVAGAMKDVTQVIGRLTEESQFLWWLIGRRSPSLDLSRNQISIEAYALPAAAEAANRVATLPPAPSVESLLEEALLQCGKSGRSKGTLSDLICAVDGGWAQRQEPTSVPSDLAPISTLLSERVQAGKPKAASLRKLRISPKSTISPVELAKQYFRERIFLRAMEAV